MITTLIVLVVASVCACDRRARLQRCSVVSCVSYGCDGASLGHDRDQYSRVAECLQGRLHIKLSPSYNVYVDKNAFHVDPPRPRVHVRPRPPLTSPPAYRRKGASRVSAALPLPPPTTPPSSALRKFWSGAMHLSVWKSGSPASELPRPWVWRGIPKPKKRETHSHGRINAPPMMRPKPTSMHQSLVDSGAQTMRCWVQETRCRAKPSAAPPRKVARLLRTVEIAIDEEELLPCLRARAEAQCR